MVTVIGSVRPRTDTLPDSSSPRHFSLETSVYDSSKAAPVQFTVTCFFEDTRRWHKVKTPPSGTFLCVTAKVAGRTTNTNQLALRILDLAYLPKHASALPVSSPTATPPSKRSGRWEGRAPPSTPSKRPRISDDTNEAPNPPERYTTPPEPARANTKQPSNSPSSPPPSTHPEESPTLSVTPESASRSLRSRQSTKKTIN